MNNIINLLAEAGEKTSSLLSTLMLPLLLVLLVGGFVWSSYSAKKRQKSAMELVNKLAPGDKVKTIGGVCGIVVEIDDEENTFVLETGAEFSKSYLKFDKQAIYQTEKVKKDEPAAEEVIAEEVIAEDVIAEDVAPEAQEETGDAEDTEKN